VAGTCQGPKDIPDSIAQGVQAASNVMRTFSHRDQSHCSA
jgi:heterodisulfide reductase subunit A-like polyferredoxin